MTACSDVSILAENESPFCLQGLRLFPESVIANTLGVTKGDEGVGIFIIRAFIFTSDWSSGSRLSTVELHWSFLHSLSLRGNDLPKRFIAVFRARSLQICHCLLNSFFSRISSWIGTGIGGRGSSCWRHMEVDCVNAFEVELNSSLAHASVTAPFVRLGFDGSAIYKQACNFDHSVRLKFGCSDGLI